MRHEARTMLAQRVFGLAAGCEDGNDHATLRSDPVHGNQVGRFFHGYYDDYCFLPLYVFCGEQLLVAYLRRSDIDATGEKQRHFAEVCYAAGTWDRERRVIVKAEHLTQRPNTRFVVTLRSKLLKIGARIVVRAGRIILHLASGFPLPDLFRTAAARLTAAPPTRGSLTLVT